MVNLPIRGKVKAFLKCPAALPLLTLPALHQALKFLMATGEGEVTSLHQRVWQYLSLGNAS